MPARLRIDAMFRRTTGLPHTRTSCLLDHNELPWPARQTDRFKALPRKLPARTALRFSSELAFWTSYDQAPSQLGCSTFISPSMRLSLRRGSSVSLAAGAMLCLASCGAPEPPADEAAGPPTTGRPADEPSVPPEAATPTDEPAGPPAGGTPTDEPAGSPAAGSRRRSRRKVGDRSGSE